MASSLQAQNEAHALYKHPKVIPATYQAFYNTDSLVGNTVSFKNLSKKNKLKYLNNYKHQLKYMAESGLIYFDWQPVDKYLNDLLNKLTPDSLKTKIEVKVFVVKDVIYNAMSMPNGHIYINIGLLANLKSEAALCFIIAHELAHYLKAHHLKNYKQTLLNEGRNKTAYYRFTHNNKHLEIEADEIAMALLLAQNIPIDDAIDVFKLMHRGGKISNLNSMRLYFVKKRVNAVAKKTGLDKPLNNFEEINTLCKNELLNVLLEKNDYINCIKMGLDKLTENKHSKAAYFAAEAMRRYLLLYPENAHIRLDTLLSKHIAKNNITIFDSLNNGILQKEISSVFKELTSISNKLNNAELYFTTALYNLKNYQEQPLIKEDLTNYLNKENNQYKLLAEHLLVGADVEEEMTTTKPVILVDVIKSIKYSETKQQIDFEKQNNLNATITPKLKQWLYAKYAGSKVVFIEDLIKAEFNTAIKLQSFFNVEDSLLSDTAINVFFLRPDAFELFKLLETNTIQYLKIETKEASKLGNDNVFNPLSFPSKISYLINEKRQFSIKKTSIDDNETFSVEENTFNGGIRLSKITNYLETVIE